MVPICRCGAHFCWQCLGVFAAGDIYRHMENAHGGMFGREAAPVPDVNLFEQHEVLRQAQRQGMQRREQAEQAEGLHRRAQMDGQNDHWRADLERLQRERLERLRRDNEIMEAARQRDLAERQRNALAIAARQQREQAERRRQEDNSGWGCMIA
jgi:hypothetical protein